MLGSLLALWIWHVGWINSHATSVQLPDTALAYQCAKQVAGLLRQGEQVGPLFFNHDLIFTSIVAADSSQILLVHARSGLFSVRLMSQGLNRLRFVLPSDLREKPTPYYLSYIPGDSIRSRYLEFSMIQPPPGRDEIDYDPVYLRRADDLLAHLEYAILETADNTLRGLTDGKLDRRQMSVKPIIRDCDHLARRSPSLDRRLRRQLDVIDTIVVGVKPTPTNVAAQTSTFKPSAANSNVSSGRGPASIVSPSSRMPASVVGN